MKESPRRWDREEGWLCLPTGTCDGVAEFPVGEADGMNVKESKELKKLLAGQCASCLVPRVPFQMPTSKPGLSPCAL